MTDENDVTGRDGWIQVRAFYWALKWQQNLPEDFRDQGDIEDIKAVILARFPQQVRAVAEGDAAVLASIMASEKPAHFTDVEWSDFRERASHYLKPADLIPDVEDGTTKN